MTSPELQQRVMRGGVRRLLALTAAPSAATVRRDLPRGRAAAIGTAGIPVDELAADAVLAAVDAVLDDAGEQPWDEAAFAELQRRVRAEAGTVARRALETAADVLAAETRVRLRLAELTAEAARPVVDDAEAHLGRLLRPGFVVAVGARRLPDVLRYVRGVEHRLERLDVARDARRRAEVVPLEQRYAALAGRLGSRRDRDRRRLAAGGAAGQRLRPAPRHQAPRQPHPRRPSPRPTRSLIHPRVSVHRRVSVPEGAHETLGCAQTLG